jgi:hypothetical protein
VTSKPNSLRRICVAAVVGNISEILIKGQCARCA